MQYLLNEADKGKIQSALKVIDDLRKNLSTRGIVDAQDGDQAPEAYIAKGSSSIAAMSGTTPGSGEVTIYEILNGTLTGSGFTRIVYNFTSNLVGANTWTFVERDKFGKWFISAIDPTLTDANGTARYLDAVTCVSPIMGTLQGGVTVIVDGSGSTSNRVQTGTWVETTRLYLARGNSTGTPTCEEDPDCDCDNPVTPTDCVNVGAGTGTGGSVCSQLFCRTFELTLTGISGDCTCITKTALAEYDDTEDEWQTGQVYNLGCGGSGFLSIRIWFDIASTSWLWSVSDISGVVDSGTIVTSCDALYGSTFDIDIPAAVGGEAICPTNGGVIRVTVDQADECDCDSTTGTGGSGGSVVTSCCPSNPWPQVMPARVVGAIDCDPITGNFTYNASQNRWEFAETCGSGQQLLGYLYCVEDSPGVWAPRLAVACPNASSSLGVKTSTVNCSNLQMIFNFTDPDTFDFPCYGPSPNVTWTINP